MDEQPAANPRAVTPMVLVIGDVMLDVIAAPRKPIAFATDTPANVTLSPGGSGANQAAWLAHFGNAVRFVGRVGADTYIDHANALSAHGVVPLLSRDDKLRTGVLVTLIGTHGERSFLTDRGANAQLGPADLPDALLIQTALVHVSGYAFSSPGPRAAVRNFIAEAVARGITCTVDAGSLAFLRDVGPAAFLEWTYPATICFANADEAALLADSPDRDEQLQRLGANYATVVVTRGAGGADATANGGTQRLSIPAPLVDAIDTSGAGDAFLAAYLTAHLRGADIEECLTHGVRAGSAAVAHYGGRPQTNVEPLATAP